MLIYLLEFRQRILRVSMVFLVFFIAFFLIAPTLFHYLMRPLLMVLPHQPKLIATQITTALFTPIKLAADLSLLSTAPYALFEGWCFIAPGLYRHEKKKLRFLLYSSLCLFCAGILFCFYIVLPLMLSFFIKAVPNDVLLLPDIRDTLHFITTMLLLFGLFFQLPLLCWLGTYCNILDRQTLSNLRPYAIVAAFIAGMLLTPPDVGSQLLLAIPLCLLYEIGVVLSRFSMSKKQWNKD